MGSSPRKGCRSALFGDREGCRSDGAEGCRSKGSSRRKGVDLRSGDREGCRSAAWSELELFDPRLRRVRKCSIRRFARTGRVSIRAPGAREGCRSMARIRPEGCRSARPATPKGLDPRDRADRICSIRAPEDRASVRSARAWSRVQVFDPRVRQVFDPQDRADRKGVDPRARRPRRVSIHGMDRAGGVSIRAFGDSEGSRSAPPETAQVFDPCVRQVFDPRLRRLASVRSARPASVRSAGSCGPEGCRSARPAPAKGVDPWHGSGRKGVDPCVRRLQRVSIPGIERLRRCSIRGFGACASVRSVAWSRTDLFDPRPRRPRECSIRGRGAGCKCSIRTPSGRVSVRSARPDKCSICRIERPGRVSIHAPATAKGVDSRLGAGRKGVDPHAWRPRGVSIHGVAWPGSVRSSRPATVFQACRPRGATVSPGRAAWRCRATRER